MAEVHPLELCQGEALFASTVATATLEMLALKGVLQRDEIGRAIDLQLMVLEVAQNAPGSNPNVIAHVRSRLEALASRYSGTPASPAQEP